MYVLALRIDLRFPHSRSLKEKRALLRPIVDAMRSRFAVSVAETDHADAWQRAELGVALVSGDVHVLEDLAAEIERFVWNHETEVLEIEHIWLEVDK